MITKTIEHEYELQENETIIKINTALYIATQDELQKYLKGEITEIDFDDAPYEEEVNEIFYMVEI
jgi:hypothetical protein